MGADRDLQNSSFNYIVAEKSGDGDNTKVSVSLNSSSTLPYLLSSNYDKKAVVSLDQLFRPISSKSGTTFSYLREANEHYFLESPQYTLTNRPLTYNYGLIPTVVTVDPETLEITSSDPISHEDIVDRANRVDDEDKDIRSIGLALPMYAAGMGLDKYDEQVGTSSPTDNDITNYRAGPIDLRWDNERNVWGMNSLLIKGYLKTDITAPTERNVPTTFLVQTYKHDKDGEIVEDREYNLYNYDLHLSVDLQTKCVYDGTSCTFEDEDIWIVAIGGIPIYIGSVNE